MQNENKLQINFLNSLINKVKKYPTLSSIYT